MKFDIFSTIVIVSTFGCTIATCSRSRFAQEYPAGRATGYNKTANEMQNNEKENIFTTTMKIDSDSHVSRGNIPSSVGANVPRPGGIPQREGHWQRATNDRYQEHAPSPAWNDESGFKIPEQPNSKYPFHTAQMRSGENYKRTMVRDRAPVREERFQVNARVPDSIVRNVAHGGRDEEYWDSGSRRRPQGVDRRNVDRPIYSQTRKHDMHGYDPQLSRGQNMYRYQPLESQNSESMSYDHDYM